MTRSFVTFLSIIEYNPILYLDNKFVKEISEMS